MPLNHRYTYISNIEYSETDSYLPKEMPSGMVIANPDESLIGRWLFNEAAGNVAHDLSRYGNHGDLVDEARWEVSSIGRVISFGGTGTNDRVEVGNPVTPAITDYTVIYFAYPSGSSSGSRGVFAINAYDPAFYLSNRVVTIYDAGSGIIPTSVTLPLNEWSHVVLTRSGSTVSVYLNGQFIETVTHSITFPTITKLHLGWTGWTPEIFDGSLRDIHFYDRHFTADEVGRIYNEPYANFVSTDDYAAVAPSIFTSIITLASETNTSNSIDIAKAVSVGLSSETDTSFAITEASVLTIPVNVSQDTSTAFAISSNKSVLVAQSLETDSVFGITAVDNISVAITQETDIGFILTPNMSGLINPSLEVDSAFSVEPFGPIDLSVGVALETNIGANVNPYKNINVGLALEAELADIIGALSSSTLGLPIETDSAFIIKAVTYLAIGIAVESDSAFAIRNASSLLDIDLSFAYDARQSLEVFKVIDINNLQSVVADTDIDIKTGTRVSANNDIHYSWQGNVLWVVREIGYDFRQTIESEQQTIPFAHGVLESNIVTVPIAYSSSFGVTQILNIGGLPPRIHQWKIGKHKTIRFIDK